jgi:hypothetical protein
MATDNPFSIDGAPDATTTTTTPTRRAGES